MEIGKLHNVCYAYANLRSDVVIRGYLLCCKVISVFYHLTSSIFARMLLLN